MMPKSVLRSVFLTVTLVFVFGLAGGCSDSIQPPAKTDIEGSGLFEGSFEGNDGDFVLKQLDIPGPYGEPIRVELIGRNVSFNREPVGEVSIEVALRNIDIRTLYAPAEVVVYSFNPPSVFPTNADWTACLDSIPGPAVIDDCEFGFDYTGLFGDDGALLPGEISDFRTWFFSDPDLAPFSFAATVRVSMDPNRARIAGVVFGDDNRNGHFDSNEAPFPGGFIQAVGPELEERQVRVDENGRYAIPIRAAGLYTLTAFPPPTFQFAPVVPTTPNPLEVLITPAGPDGQPQSFLDADFGFANLLIFPPIRFIDPGDTVETDQYSLDSIAVEGEIMTLDVGFSGCSPDHPFQLFMVGGFMESFPVQARLILSHDDRDELCDAYFLRTLQFDLAPLVRAYEEGYSDPGMVILNFIDWQGETHRLELAIP